MVPCCVLLHVSYNLSLFIKLLMKISQSLWRAEIDAVGLQALFVWLEL